MKAAIELLTSALNAIKEKAPDEPILKDFEQAIRVLEATEKIERKRCLEFLDELCRFCYDHPIREYDQIHALLESLPDKEPE